MSNIFKIDKDNIHCKLINKAAQILKTGGTIVFPTTDLYGIGVDALNADAVKKVFEIKKRSFSKPLLILVKDSKTLNKLVTDIPKSAEILMNKFWPGRLTIIFNASDALPKLLTSNTNKVGIRIPSHPIAAALTKAADRPITATSANMAGETGCFEIKDADKNFWNKFDMIINAGRLKGGKGSTVADVTGNSLKILRIGSIPKKDLLSTLTKTGNFF